jgi:hypothetical protein
MAEKKDKSFFLSLFHNIFFDDKEKEKTKTDTKIQTKRRATVTSYPSSHNSLINNNSQDLEKDWCLIEVPRSKKKAMRKTMPPRVVNAQTTASAVLTPVGDEPKEFEQLVVGLPRNHSESNQKVLKKQIESVKINLDDVRDLAKKEGLHHSFRATLWSVLLVSTNSHSSKTTHFSFENVLNDSRVIFHFILSPTALLFKRKADFTQTSWTNIRNAATIQRTATF